jgi:hypothetical protein
VDVDAHPNANVVAQQPIIQQPEDGAELAANENGNEDDDDAEEQADDNVPPHQEVSE